MRFTIPLLIGVLTAPAAYAADLAPVDGSADEIQSSLEIAGWRLTTDIEQEVGYATNPDMETGSNSTYFTRTSGTVAGEQKLGNIEGKFKLGTEYTYRLDSQVKSVSENFAEFNVEHKIDENQKQSFHVNDSIEVNGTETNVELQNKYTYEHSSSIAESELHLSLAQESDLQATGDDREDTWTHAALNTRQVFLPENMFAPYIGTGVGWVMHQKINTPTADRTGIDASLAAGVRFKPNDELEASFGLRRNSRRTGDANISGASRNFIEADLTWNPLEEMELTAGVTRKFSQASADGAAMNDVKEFSAGASFNADDEITLDFEASHEIEKAIGGDELTRSTEISLATERKVYENVSLTAKFSKEWETTEDLTAGTKETVENLEAAIGVKAAF